MITQYFIREKKIVPEKKDESMNLILAEEEIAPLKIKNSALFSNPDTRPINPDPLADLLRNTTPNKKAIDPEPEPQIAASKDAKSLLGKILSKEPVPVEQPPPKKESLKENPALAKMAENVKADQQPKDSLKLPVADQKFVKDEKKPEPKTK